LDEWPNMGRAGVVPVVLYALLRNHDLMLREVVIISIELFRFLLSDATKAEYLGRYCRLLNHTF